MSVRFNQYCRSKEREARDAVLPPYRTVALHLPFGAISVPSATIGHAGFSTAISIEPRAMRTSRSRISSSSQSHDGNTGADDPGTLGGGNTDKHLIYEGLSRVDADAVLAGATTARSDELVFSVWHPELASLRRERGRAPSPGAGHCQQPQRRCTSRPR